MFKRKKVAKNLNICIAHLNKRNTKEVLPVYFDGATRDRLFFILFLQIFKNIHMCCMY
jgi:hypothetical protein